MTTTTKTPAFETSPLSHFQPRAGLGEFLWQLRYRNDRDKHVKFQGDIFLIEELDRACKLAAQRGVAAKVGELSPEVIRQAVSRVEDRLRVWELGGDEGDDIHARLDSHFAEAQQRWRAERTEQATQLAQRQAAIEEANRREASAELDAGGAAHLLMVQSMGSR